MNTQQSFRGKTVVFVIVVVLIAFGIYFLNNRDDVSAPVTTFEECAKEGNPLMESYPRQCVSKAGQHFTEVIKQPEMSLTMKKWNWVSTTYSDGKTIAPRKANVFTINFDRPDGFSISTDCNGGGGEYVMNGNEIKFNRMISTQMACGDSQEGVFTKSLAEVSSYHFTDNGELVFDLKFDSGSMVFN